MYFLKNIIINDLIIFYNCLVQFVFIYFMIDEWENALGSIRWAAEYFIKCHVSDYEFYGQVGDFNLDQGFWGRPEDMNMSRPSYKIDKNRPGKYSYINNNS